LRRSFAFPSTGISIPLGGGCGSEMNLLTSSCARHGGRQQLYYKQSLLD
jgi:hypothetical protein